MKTIDELREKLKQSLALAEVLPGDWYPVRNPQIVTRDDWLRFAGEFWDKTQAFGGASPELRWVSIGLPSEGGDSVAACLVGNGPNAVAISEHIADARTAVPRMARMLLAAIEAADYYEGDECGGADAVLSAILRAAEEGSAHGS